MGAGTTERDLVGSLCLSTTFLFDHKHVKGVKEVGNGPFLSSQISISEVVRNESVHHFPPARRWYLRVSGAGPKEGYWGEGGYKEDEEEVLFVGRSDEFAGSEGTRYFISQFKMSIDVSHQPTFI